MSGVLRPDPLAEPHKGKARYLADAKLKRDRKKREAERRKKDHPTGPSGPVGDSPASSSKDGSAPAAASVAPEEPTLHQMLVAKTEDQWRKEKRITVKSTGSVKIWGWAT